MQRLLIVTWTLIGYGCGAQTASLSQPNINSGLEIDCVAQSDSKHIDLDAKFIWEHQPNDWKLGLNGLIKVVLLDRNRNTIYETRHGFLFPEQFSSQTGIKSFVERVELPENKLANIAIISFGNGDGLIRCDVPIKRQ